jgi:hypothetical protein
MMRKTLPHRLMRRQSCRAQRMRTLLREEKKKERPEKNLSTWREIERGQRKQEEERVENFYSQ